MENEEKQVKTPFYKEVVDSNHLLWAKIRLCIEFHQHISTIVAYTLNRRKDVEAAQINSESETEAIGPRKDKSIPSPSGVILQPAINENNVNIISIISILSIT